MTETTHDLNPPTERRLERSRSDRMIAGVCGGLARYFDIHPAVYRVGFVVLTLLGGAGFVIYIAALLVIPIEGEEESIASAALKERRNHPMPLIGLGLVAVALVSLLSRATLWPHGDAWIGLLVLGAAILFVTRHGSGVPGPAATQIGHVPAPAEARRGSTLGRVFAGIGIAFATLVAFALIAAAIFAATFHVHLDRGVGERHYAVASHADLERSYRLGIGRLVLDLRNVNFRDGVTDLSARVDVGDLRIVVPATTRIQLDATAQAGKVEALASTDDGHHARVDLQPVGTPQLVLHAHVGAGRVEIVRAG